MAELQIRNGRDERDRCEQRETDRDASTESARAPAWARAQRGASHSVLPRKHAMCDARIVAANLEVTTVGAAAASTLPDESFSVRTTRSYWLAVVKPQVTLGPLTQASRTT